MPEFNWHRPQIDSNQLCKKTNPELSVNAQSTVLIPAQVLDDTA